MTHLCARVELEFNEFLLHFGARLSGLGAGIPDLVNPSGFATDITPFGRRKAIRRPDRSPRRVHMLGGSCGIRSGFRRGIGDSERGSESGGEPDNDIANLLLHFNLLIALVIAML